MSSPLSASRFPVHIALPHDHGSWVFLLSPLLIGLFIGGNWNSSTLYLSVAALAAFFIRQPLTVAVKALAGRRTRKELPTAIWWAVLYGLLALAALTALLIQGHVYLLWLALPGVSIFVWHLVLVSRREERRQIGVDVLASGALALAAPAALWVSSGQPDALGWWLWACTWFQSAASIVYAFLRLEQRVLKEVPPPAARFKMARRSLIYTTFNLACSAACSALPFIPPMIWLAYAVQWLESLWGTYHPAVGHKPTRIGIRQLLVSILFTVVFISVW